MENEILEKKLSITKKGRNVVWVQTHRHASDKARYALSSAVCSPDGNFTKIVRTLTNYTKIRNLVRIAVGDMYIQSKRDITGSTTELFTVENIDIDEKKVTLKKVATFKDNKWDNTSYLDTYKRAIHSVSMRAKKYYNLSDV